jgi:hypothetical protein
MQGQSVPSPSTQVRICCCFCFLVSFCVVVRCLVVLVSVQVGAKRASWVYVRAIAMGGSMSTVGTGSQRLKEVTIHAGPVSAIAIHAGAVSLL